MATDAEDTTEITVAGAGVHVLSGLDKGVPPRADGLALADVPGAGWNVLREDLPLPVCVLLADALNRNIGRLQRFADAAGVLLAPHGKTSMSPQLFDRQLAAGSWGLTFATCHQLQVARRAGVSRVFYANQLVGEAEIRYVCEELRRDQEFDFYCLVDSVAGVRLLADRVAAARPGRPVQVLLEVGFAGGRCGVRDLATALQVADTIHERGPELALVGVEGFEGLLQYREPEQRESGVREFLQFLVAVTEALDQRALLDSPTPLLSAGGSAFYDLVLEELSAARLSRPARIVLRSGCYLTHDSGLYQRLLQDVHSRTASSAPSLEPALEVWGQVLSTPEPDLVIVSAGRRDFGQDAGNPVPVKHLRRGQPAPPRVPDPQWSVVAVSDQHAHLRLPIGHGVDVGDLVALGVSHPCTTLDKWRVVYLVDAGYDVVGAVRTWF